MHDAGSHGGRLSTYELQDTIPFRKLQYIVAYRSIVIRSITTITQTNVLLEIILIKNNNYNHIVRIGLFQVRIK